jgi:hypothetical protein
MRRIYRGISWKTNGSIRSQVDLTRTHSVQLVYAESNGAQYPSVSHSYSYKYKIRSRQLCVSIIRQHSRYSDWLRAGGERGRSLSPGRVKNFSSSRRTYRLWGPPNLLSSGYRGFSGGKATRVWSWLLTSYKCRGQENVDLYIHSPIRLHGVVLN